MDNIKSVLEQPAGTAFSLDVMVSSVIEKRTKVGKSFLLITVQDKSGQTTFPVWDNIEKLLNGLSRTDIVFLGGKTKLYNEELQLNPDSIRRLRDHNYSLTDFQDAYDILSSVVFLQSVIYDLPDPWKQLLTKLFYLDTTRHAWDKFCSAPAAKSRHQNKVGGLVVHTSGIVNILSKIYSSYTPTEMNPLNVVDITPLVNYGRLIFCAIMHDYNKTKDYLWEPVVIWNPDTKVSHIYSVLSVIEQLNRECDSPLSYKELQIVLDIVLTHHGPFSENKPTCLEAWLLHYADVIDATIYEAYEGKDLTRS